MFTSHMSYADLSCALAMTHECQNFLYKSQWQCIASSLQDPFLSKMLILYPLPSKSQKIYQNTLDRLRAHNEEHDPLLDSDVHNPIFGGVRSRTDCFLKKTYPEPHELDLKDRLTEFVHACLHDSEVQEQLEIAERERYKKRLKEHEKGNLPILEKQHHFEDIKEDFKEYLAYLFDQKDRGSTYGWSVLSALLLRYDSLTEEDRSEAKFLLIRGLDDSRTGYHDKPFKYIPSKNYTCQRGLEERMLDHNAFIVPGSEKIIRADLLEKTLCFLYDPFVDRSASEEGCRWTYSQSLYCLYLEAAGYVKDAEIKDILALREELPISLEHLKNEYLSRYSGVESLKKMRDFSIFVSMLAKGVLEPSNQMFSDLISFFERKQALEIRTLSIETLTRPQRTKEDYEIEAEMLRIGPFIDRTHLRNILALHDNKGSFDTLERSAELNTDPSSEVTILPDKNAIIMAYEEYLDSINHSFYHFDMEGLGDLLMGHLFTPPCHQDVLLEWLLKQESLSSSKAHALAILSVKAGYGKALKLLIEQYGVSPHYYDDQECLNLLHMASFYGHDSIVVTLLHMQVNINQKMETWGATALIFAAMEGHINVIKVLGSVDKIFNGAI